MQVQGCKRENDRKLKAEIGGRYLQAEGHQGLPAASRSRGGWVQMLLTASEGTGIAGTLISDTWPPDLRHRSPDIYPWDSTFPLFKLRSVVLCAAAQNTKPESSREEVTRGPQKGDKGGTGLNGKGQAAGGSARVESCMQQR